MSHLRSGLEVPSSFRAAVPRRGSARSRISPPCQATPSAAHSSKEGEVSTTRLGKDHTGFPGCLTLKLIVHIEQGYGWYPKCIPFEDVLGDWMRSSFPKEPPETLWWVERNMDEHQFVSLCFDKYEIPPHAIFATGPVTVNVQQGCWPHSPSSKLVFEAQRTCSETICWKPFQVIYRGIPSESIQYV